LVAGTILLGLCLPPLASTHSAPSSAAQEPQPEAPLVEVLGSTAQGVTLDVTVPPLLEEEVQQQGATYQRLSLHSAGTSGDVGRPELPSFGRYVAIPRGAEVNFQILADEVETRSGYLVYPAQEPYPEQGEEPPFELEAAAYQVDEFLPTETVEIEGPYVIRGVEVVLLRFHPIQYNAAQRTLKIHSGLQVGISFTGGGDFADRRVRSPYFEPLLSSLLLNYSALATSDKRDLGSGLSSATGCDFLIITAPAFADEANLLAEWKIRRGIDTRVRTTNQTGSTASAIKSYIQNAYDNWSPAPSFVLFLGDAEFIPTNYQTDHPQQLPEDSLIGTDLYYATVDGTDYFPDISTGRISVDTASQAAYIVDRIVDYERSPPTKASFYSTVALAAYFEDEDEPFTREDREWVRTSEEIASYLGGEGYDEQRIYRADDSVNPLYYSDGSPLPSYLLREDGFPWIGSTSAIVSWVNSGTLILNHRDHGMRSMWVVPLLEVSHVQGLTNRKRLPVVFSINCETGWFDNETDDPGHGTPSGEVTFAEAWQRNQNGGAAGVVAATRFTYGGYNDHLDKGLIDAIWPDFKAYTPTSGPFASPNYHMGQVLNYAKLYMATFYGEGIYRKIHFEMFHYFGDPTMEIWTSRPRTLTVHHSPVYYTGATSYTVTVQNGALVSLVKDGQILGTAVATGGKATVDFAAPLTSGTIYLTVTKHNRKPYESTISVVDMPMRAYVPLVIAEQ
jgi:hypothetical protein